MNPTPQNALPLEIATIRSSAHSKFAVSEFSGPAVRARMEDNLRLLVAFYLGWVEIAWYDMDCPNNADYYANRPERKGDHWKQRLPFYASDLNAMHAVTSALSDDDWARFWEHLEAVVSGRRLIPLLHRKTIDASASERALAFVETMRASSVGHDNEKHLAD